MIDRLKTRLAREESGFTLIELLVVIIILGILLAIAVPSYLGLRDRADKTAAASNVRAVVPDVEQFYSDNGTYVGVDDATNGVPKYDQGVDMSKFVFTATSTTSYTVCTKSGSYYGWKIGPSGQIASGTSADATTAGLTVATDCPA